MYERPNAVPVIASRSTAKMAYETTTIVGKET
jgi:hypothetical protein